MKKTKFTFEGFKACAYFVKPYPGMIIAIVLVIFLYALLEGLSLGIFFNVLDNTLTSDTAQKNWMLRFTNYLIQYLPISNPLVAACSLLIIIVTLKAVVGYGGQVMSTVAGFKIWGDNQLQVYKKFIYSDYLKFLNEREGSVVYRCLTAPSNLGFILQAIPQVLVEIFKMLILGGLLLSIATKISVGVIIFCFCYFSFTRFISKKVSYHTGQGRMKAHELQNVLVTEMASGFRQIQLFNAQERWIDKYKKARDIYFHLGLMDQKWYLLPKHLLDFIFISGFSILIIFLSINRTGDLQSLLPLLGALGYAFMRIVPSMNLLSGHLMRLMASFPDMQMLRNLLQQDMTKVVDGPQSFNQLQRGIFFKKAAFSYPTRKNIINTVDMSFIKGKQTAIVGPSGSGKTTIVDLIVRLFDVTEGEILVDTVNIKELNIRSWRNTIGYVSQDTFIFNASVADNIAFGHENLSKEIIEKAAKAAHAHDFIIQLPDGYDTVVGDKGLKLSGGQRQRVAIARALIGNPEIIILDEATSALDSVSEQSVQEAIREISKEHTVIMIAHRLSTVIESDCIYFLDKGGVVEVGSHSELIQKGGKYAEFYNLQSKIKDEQPVIN